MYYNTLFVGMDVHKENFTLCCYDMMQDKIFYTQKLEPDYNQILKYLTFVRKAFRKDEYGIMFLDNSRNDKKERSRCPKARERSIPKNSSSVRCI